MHAFVWQYVGPVTDSYHSDGGLLVVAVDLAAARVLILAETGPISEELGPDRECRALTEDPDLILDLASEHEPCLLVFPDAGCC